MTPHYFTEHFAQMGGQQAFAALVTGTRTIPNCMEIIKKDFQASVK